MTRLPDWLVERAALDEVPPASRERIDTADAAELAARIAGLRAQNTAELAAHPAAPAVAQIEARVNKTQRRRSALTLAGLAFSAVAAVTVAWIVIGRSQTPAVIDDSDGIRVKGHVRLLAFRLVDDRIEELTTDQLVRAGDVIQLRYNAAGRRHGVIASIDGAGAVTLHFPASEDAPTAIAPKTTTLPNAYALDDAPKFERFFFVTSDEPIDVHATLDALRELARDDGERGVPELPASVQQWSLRLRKPESK